MSEIKSDLFKQKQEFIAQMLVSAEKYRRPENQA